MRTELHRLSSPGMKRSGRTLVLAFLFSTLALAGTTQPASAAKVEVPTAKSLLGKKFESVFVKGSTPALEARTIRLRFFMHAHTTGKPKKATLGISGGCNAWGSGYQIRKGRLGSQGKYEGTAIRCKPDPDRWLLNKLRKGFKARVICRRLILTRPAEGVKLVFKRVVKEQSVPDEPDADYPIPVGDPATVGSVEGKSFESVKVIGEQVKEPIEISFDDKLGAYLGCNRMSGQYEIENGTLRWMFVITTDMACQLSKDSWFSGLLDKGVEATVKGPWLVLASGKTTIVLKQVAEAEPPERVPPGEPSTVESLDGRSFKSVSVIGRYVKKPIEISFRTGTLNRSDDEGKQVVGNGLGAYLGCNWMGGEYEIKDGQLRWFDVISTLMGCYGGGNERDTWFYKLLNQGVEVSESEAGLIFDRGPTQIVFKEVPPPVRG